MDNEGDDYNPRAAKGDMILLKKSKVLKRCLRCGEDFNVVESKVHKRKYCSRDCRTKAGQVELICEYCKKKFTEVLSRVKNNRGRFCDWKCRRKAGSQEIVCFNCGKTVRREKNACNTQRSYCSPKCHYSDKYKATRLRGTRMISKICEYCGEGFQINKYKHEQGKGRFCSRPCYDKGYVPTDDTIRRICIARAKQILPTKDTSIELIMQGLLDQMGIKYFRNYYVFYGDRRRGGSFDFAIPDKKIAIECDGIYWHRRVNNMKADQRKKVFCKKSGWKLLRFADKEIIKNLVYCREKIKASIIHRGLVGVKSLI
jgi:Protein of unknown function (DUF559)